MRFFLDDPEDAPPAPAPKPKPKRGRGRPVKKAKTYKHDFAPGDRVYVTAGKSHGFYAEVLACLPPKTKSSSVSRYRLKSDGGGELTRFEDKVFADAASAAWT